MALAGTMGGRAKVGLPSHVYEGLVWSHVERWQGGHQDGEKQRGWVEEAERAMARADHQGLPALVPIRKLVIHRSPCRCSSQKQSERWHGPARPMGEN